MTAMARPALLYFLLWLGVTLSSAMDLEKRVYGGQRCGDDERLYHVKLIATDKAGEEYICSGSLIAPQWVLTAAHCWKEGGTMEAYVNFHPGPHEPPIDGIDPKVGRKVFKQYDIMLVKLAHSPQNINTVAIPTKDQCKDNDIKVDDEYDIAGYEHGNVNGLKVLQSADHLQCGTLTAAECEGSSGCFPDYPKEKWICGEDASTDTGGGDSGSGVVKNNVIYGVVSRGGIKPCFRTAKALRVCPFRKWIRDTAKLNN